MATVSNVTVADKEGLIVCFGEMLIDFVPTVSGVSLAEATEFLKAPGGAPANVAIAVSRLGGKAAFIGKLSNDEFGHMLAGILTQNGVDDNGLTFDNSAMTALAFVTLRADGEREFMFYRKSSADTLLEPQELNLGLIGSVCSSDLPFSSPIFLVVIPCFFWNCLSPCVLHLLPLCFEPLTGDERSRSCFLLHHALSRA
ncbi:carbohydrate kinase PfkB [Ancistrocladus abbreviatus]